MAWFADKLYCPSPDCDGNPGHHPRQCPVTERRDALDGTDYSAMWCEDCQEHHDRLHCPECGAAMERQDLSEFVDIGSDRAEDDAPAPDLSPELAPVWIAYHDLGSDQGGQPLLSEQVAWLDEAGIVDRGEREVWRRAWSAIATANALEIRRRLELSRLAHSKDRGIR